MMTKADVSQRIPSRTEDKNHCATLWSMLKETVQHWTADNVPTHGAALAYYTVFAIAPLLLISIAVAATVFGNEAASGELFRIVREWTGDSSAAFLQDIVRNGNSHPAAGLLSSIIGGLALFFGASSVFVQLQTSLNVIWRVEARPGQGIWGVVKNRLVAFGFVLMSGVLLLSSLLVTVGISFAGDFFTGMRGSFEMTIQIANALISVGIVTVLFALIYRFLPEAQIAWRDVWIGALLTAILFTIGKSLVGFYLGRSGVGSVFGAAGSLIVFLVWVFYSAQIIFFGAEFTKVHAMRNQSASETPCLRGRGTRLEERNHRQT